jgi:rhodanese-related sulfurtransferase/DNA-directed RNA polymerase subunit RPC12/RpoP
MKILLILFWMIPVISVDRQTQDEYVCTPCGYSCDDKTHAGPGTCESCNMKLVKKSTIHFTNLTSEQFCERIRVNPAAIVLDVRSPSEFDGTIKEVPSFGHFNKAINLDVRELEARMDELSVYKDREILVYCSHNHRSPRASYLLGVGGFKNVKNMVGGVSAFSVPLLQECLKKEFILHGN